MESSNEYFQIVGGARLVGEVKVHGAKNSALKLMAASLLAVGETTIENVPDIADVEIIPCDEDGLVDYDSLNDLIDQYSRSNPNLFFIKTAKQLLGPDGKYQPNLYIADKLHFNAKGYEIWTSTIRQTIENMP